MKKLTLIFFTLLIFTVGAFGQKSKFTGAWEHWWDKEASKGIVIELKENKGRVSGTASGFIPHLYEAQIKSAKIVGNSFTANIEDDWGNTGVVKITVRGNKLYWRVLKSNYKGSMTFPQRADLTKTK